MDRSRTWVIEPNIRDSLALDPTDAVAATTLERHRGARVDYDVMLRILDELFASCFVVFHDYVATVDALRYELARDTYLDLALNILRAQRMSTPWWRLLVAHTWQPCTPRSTLDAVFRSGRRPDNLCRARARSPRYVRRHRVERAPDCVHQRHAVQRRAPLALEPLLTAPSRAVAQCEAPFRA